jgi:hypothetical protein
MLIEIFILNEWKILHSTTEIVQEQEVELEVVVQGEEVVQEVFSIFFLFYLSWCYQKSAPNLFADAEVDSPPSFTTLKANSRFYWVYWLV